MTQLPLLALPVEVSETPSVQGTAQSIFANPDPILLLKIFLSKGSPQTQRGHQNDLTDFALFLQAQSRIEAVVFLLGRSQSELNALAYAYRQHQISRKLAPATTNRRLSSLRSLLKLAKMLGLCANSIEIENLTIEPYRDTRGPGQEGVTKLLQALSERTDAKGARDRAMIRLMYDLALRRAEVVSLDLSHIDFIEGIVWVLGKGRNSRQKLSLAPETAEALAGWISFRGDAPGPLFHNLDNSHQRGRLTDSAVYRVVRGLGEKVGIKTRPHGLRHAAITFALDATKGDVRAVQRFSRHKSLNILLIYDDQRKDLAGEVARLVAKSIPAHKKLAASEMTNKTESDTVIQRKHPNDSSVTSTKAECPEFSTCVVQHSSNALEMGLETKPEVGRQGPQQDKPTLVEAIQEFSVAPLLDAREKTPPKTKEPPGKSSKPSTIT